MDPELTRYITENRERYTREAIDAHLLRAGHTQAEIDAAWSGLSQERPTDSEDRIFWLSFLGSVTAMYGITFLVYAASFYEVAAPGPPAVESPSGFVSATFLIALLVAAALSITLVRQNRSAAAGTASGLLSALVIPFVFLVIVAGVCTTLTGVPLAGWGG